jgi:hypothetical protein
LHYTRVLCQYMLYKPDHTYLTYLMLQRQLSHFKSRKLDHRQDIGVCGSVKLLLTTVLKFVVKKLLVKAKYFSVS